MTNAITYTITTSTGTVWLKSDRNKKRAIERATKWAEGLAPTVEIVVANGRTGEAVERVRGGRSDQQAAVESARVAYESKVSVYRAMPKLSAADRAARWVYFRDVVTPLNDAFDAAIKARDAAEPCLCGCPNR